MRADVASVYPDYFEANPDYQTFADQAARTVEVPNVANSIEIWQTFRDSYSKAVIFGETDVADALTEAADEVDGLAGQS
jgi:multiple sugar transport system substrate-binding protein